MVHEIPVLIYKSIPGRYLASTFPVRWMEIFNEERKILLPVYQSKKIFGEGEPLLFTRYKT